MLALPTLKRLHSLTVVGLYPGGDREVSELAVMELTRSLTACDLG